MAACGVGKGKSTASTVAPERLNSDDYDYYLAEHLRECKFAERRYKKLLGILGDLRDKSKNDDDFLGAFADKCYHRETNRKRAKSEAKRFLESVFGPSKEIYSLGPEKAIANKVRELYGNTRKGSDDSKDDDDDILTPTRIKEDKQSKIAALKKSLTSSKKKEAKEQYTMKLGRFKIGRTLGEGGTAKVRLALDTEENKQVAIKILKPKYAKTALKEIGLLKALDHKNIIRVHQYFPKILWEGQRTSAFVVELANGGELIEYMMYTGKFEAELARWFFEKLVAGVAYCHNEGIVHRDLKHDNCLLDDNFQLKITDFGFARYYDKNKDSMQTAIGTAQYAAPEILARANYNEKVDIFSLGVMLFITISGSQPWRKADKNGDRWYQMWRGGREKFWAYHAKRNGVEFSKDAKKLLSGMLAHKPKERFNMKEVQQSGWLNNGRKCNNDQAGAKFRKRKTEVDAKKRNASLPEEVGRRGKARKSIPTPQDGENAIHVEIKLPIFEAPLVYDAETKKRKKKLPLTSFKTKDQPKLVFELIKQVITDMRGTVTTEYGQGFPHFVEEKTVKDDKGEDKKVLVDDEDNETRVSLDFEVRFHPLGKLINKKGIKNFDDGGVVAAANVELYRLSDDNKEADEEGNTVVVFTSKRSDRGSVEDRRAADQDSKFYLSRVFGDIMIRIGFLRTDVDTDLAAESAHAAEDQIIKQAMSGLDMSKGPPQKKKAMSGAICG